uniref:Uncharacterized protein n=1 Tax=Oryza rufipogon TaxID=4529 RepID=A0A0E0P7J1_ORYRU
MVAWCPGWAVVSPAWRRPEGGLATSGKEAETARRMGWPCNVGEGGRGGEEDGGRPAQRRSRPTVWRSQSSAGQRRRSGAGWRGGRQRYLLGSAETAAMREVEAGGWEEGTLRPRWVMGRLQRRRSHGSRRRPWASCCHLARIWHPAGSSGDGCGAASMGTRRWLGWCGGGDEEPAMEAVMDRERGGACEAAAVV